MAYHAILMTGTGKRARYTIRRFMGSTCSAPIGDIYTSEEAARSAADAMGLEIRACGDCWHVMLMP